MERISPKQPKLWAAYGFLAMRYGKLDEAEADCRKEIQFHPEETIAYGELSNILWRAGRQAEAIEAGKKALALEPQNEYIAGQLATLLIAVKRYAEVSDVLKASMAANPNNIRLQVLRAQALVHTGNQEEAISELKKIVGTNSDPVLLNDLAFALRDASYALDSAKEWVQKAIDQTEKETADTSLANLQTQELRAVDRLISEWDTLGWVYFRQNNLAMAGKYLGAAWQWGQRDDFADHLAQVYKKQGNHPAAIRMWRLALVANSRNEEAQHELQNGGAAAMHGTTDGRSKATPMSAAEEFGILRTIKVPGLPVQTGSAEFFLLIGRDGIEDVRLIGESNQFKAAGNAIKAARYAWAFPDSGPEKLVRRGILSCSVYTHPSCELTMLLPSTTTMEGALPHSTEKQNAHPDAAATTPPTLLTKVEPTVYKGGSRGPFGGHGAP